MTIWSQDVFSAQEPKYISLADSIEQHIFTGALKPGERLPTHRALADLLHCNVSTITRGYREAEKRGLVTGTVGRGTYVSSDANSTLTLATPEPHSKGLIEMGLATPLYELDPDIHEGLAKLARQRDLRANLHYTAPAGLPEHRETGAAWAGYYGMQATPDDIVVCAGAQHALTCILNGLFSAGERIAASSLCYPGFKSLATAHGIRLVPIASDNEGMLPDALDTACRRDHIRGLYLMPECHNPTNARMGMQRRADIAAVAARHSLTLIEDDAYALTLLPESLRSPSPHMEHSPDLPSPSHGMKTVAPYGLNTTAPQPTHKPAQQNAHKSHHGTQLSGSVSGPLRTSTSHPSIAVSRSMRTPSSSDQTILRNKTPEPPTTPALFASAVMQNNLEETPRPQHEEQHSAAFPTHTEQQPPHTQAAQPHEAHQTKQKQAEQPTPLPPISMLLPEQSVHIAGFSKALGAGLRVAFVTAKGTMKRAITDSVLNTMWMAPTLTAALASMWIKDGTALRVIRQKQEESRWRNVEAARILPPNRFHGVPTGFYIWLALPDRWQGRGQDFEALARRHNVNLFCAERFIVGNATPPPAVRVALSGAARREDITQGLTVLASLMDAQPEFPVPIF